MYGKCVLVGLQICREVIFKVIKGDFWTAIIGISPAITKVLCITIYALLIKREVKMAGYWILESSNSVSLAVQNNTKSL